MEARLSAGGFALAYLGAIVVLGVLDGAWLGLVAKGLYQREMGELMAPEFRVWTAALFYVLYPLAVVVLCLHVQPASGWEAAVRGAVLGAAAYGAYNLTNATILKGWPMALLPIDWVWGTFVTAAAAAGGWWAAWGRH
jgi:uncharacterized membrane protein